MVSFMLNRSTNVLSLSTCAISRDDFNRFYPLPTCNVKMLFLLPPSLQEYLSPSESVSQSASYINWQSQRVEFYIYINRQDFLLPAEDDEKQEIMTKRRRRRRVLFLPTFFLCVSYLFSSLSLFCCCKLSTFSRKK